MKKAFIVLAVLAMLFMVASCVSEKPAAKPAAPAPAAAAAKPAAPVVVKPVSNEPPMVALDFEDNTAKFRAWNGPNSMTPKFEFVSDPVHGGSGALKVSNKTSDWAGIAYEFTTGDPKADWSKHTYFKFWVFGTASGKEFDIDLEDAGKEQFRSVQKDDTAGWKEVVIDLVDIKKRGDWQDSAAKQNNKLDMPLFSVQFCSVNNFSGDLVFDDFTVTN